MRPPDRSEEIPKRDVTAVELLWRHVWVRAIAYVLLALFLLYVLVTQRHVYGFALQVGLIGFLVAYVFNPVVEALGRARVPRGLAVVIVYLLLLQVLVFGSVLLTQVVAETARFVALVPNALEEFGGVLGRVSTWWGGFVDALPEFMQERFGVESADDDLALQAQEQVGAWLTGLAQALNRFLERMVTEGPTVLLAGATTIISATFQVVLITIASAYFLYDYPKITANVRRFVPVRWRPLHADLAQKADRAVGGYLRGQLLITIILGFIIWIGLSLVGVPLAVAISFLAAVFNLVPYLGPVVGTIPAVLLGFTVSPLTALLALIVFLVANQIEAHVLGPMILAKSTDIHPVTVLISILIGVGAMGIIGAFIAVPIAALAKVLLEDYLLTRSAYVEVSAGPEPPEATSGQRLPPSDAVTRPRVR
ncbi:AI-2E family transporter [soil metagenome]|nr:AI-2E family transporter [Trueperaceae bacterium]